MVYNETPTKGKIMKIETIAKATGIAFAVTMGAMFFYSQKLSRDFDRTLADCEAKFNAASADIARQSQELFNKL